MAVPQLTAETDSGPTANLPTLWCNCWQRHANTAREAIYAAAARRAGACRYDTNVSAEHSVSAVIAR
jgi:hypothetical protein